MIPIAPSSPDAVSMQLALHEEGTETPSRNGHETEEIDRSS